MLVLNEDLKKLCHKIHDNSNSDTDYHRIYTEWNIKMTAQNNGWEQNRRYNTANTNISVWHDVVILPFTTVIYQVPLIANKNA